MKTKLIIPLVLALFLGCILLAPVSAQPNKALKCEVFIELNWDWVGFGGSSPYTWIGTVSGDINGDFYVTLTEASFPGKTELFSEIWVIETTDGAVIEGFDEGVWRMANFKWLANGRVTTATGSLAHLVGSNMQYSGTTTEFPVPPGTFVTGTGKLHLTSRP